MKRFAMRYLSIALIMLLSGTVARAETDEVKLAKQYGVLYIPLVVMEQQKLVEKHAAALGIPGLKVEYKQLGGGAAMNDALLSGTINFVSTGAPSLLIFWDKTKGGTKGVAALNATAQWLLTTDPDVKTIADFSQKDRIAVTGVKVSTQAVFLQMGAARLWGIENYGRLDPLTITRPHPDALISMLSGNSEVNSHFAASPYQEREIKDPKVRKIATSYELTGIEFLTPTVLITSEAFAKANPKTTQAVIDAIVEAVDFIKNNKEKAAEIYLKASGDKVTLEDILTFMNSPETKFTVVPHGVLQIADFMYKAGVIKTKPASIKDLFLPIPGIENGN